MKVAASANSNQRFSVNFLISLVHIENRTSKKKLTFFCETYHARSFGRGQENIKNKQSQTNTNKRKNSAQQKKKIAKLAQIKCRIWTRMMAVHGAKEDFFEFSLNFCKPNCSFFPAKREKKINFNRYKIA